MEIYKLGEKIHPNTNCISLRMGKKESELRLIKEQKMLQNEIPPAHKNTVNHVIDKVLMANLLPALHMLSKGKFNKMLRRAFTEFRIHRRPIYISDAHQNHPLAGTKIAHISDLHLDLKESFPSALHRFIKASKDTINQCDLVVITGDFQDKYLNPTTKTIDGFKKLLPEINTPIIGVLGNHDRIELAKQLEELPNNCGLKILVNESIKFQTRHGNAELILQGIDDPHYYKTHRIEENKKTNNSLHVLLSHSPEIYKEAHLKGVDLCLSGHTHAGQVRLPALGAIVKAAKVPKKVLQGLWQYKTLQGHTSPGLGCSGLSIRLLCPPEITILELK